MILPIDPGHPICAALQGLRTWSNFEEEMQMELDVAERQVESFPCRGTREEEERRGEDEEEEEEIGISVIEVQS